LHALQQQQPPLARVLHVVPPTHLPPPRVMVSIKPKQKVQTKQTKELAKPTSRKHCKMTTMSWRKNSWTCPRRISFMMSMDTVIPLRN
jgi:hypothetical protein